MCPPTPHTPQADVGVSSLDPVKSLLPGRKRLIPREAERVALNASPAAAEEEASYKSHKEDATTNLGSHKKAGEPGRGGSTGLGVGKSSSSCICDVSANYTIIPVQVRLVKKEAC